MGLTILYYVRKVMLEQSRTMIFTRPETWYKKPVWKPQDRNVILQPLTPPWTVLASWEQISKNINIILPGGCHRWTSLSWQLVRFHNQNGTTSKKICYVVLPGVSLSTPSVFTLLYLYRTKWRGWTPGPQVVVFWDKPGCVYPHPAEDLCSQCLG